MGLNDPGSARMGRWSFRTRARYAASILPKCWTGSFAAVNSDYDAKRQTALDPPRIHAVPPGTTLRWLQKTGKNKLPRMRNDRTVVEQLLKIEQ